MQIFMRLLREPLLHFVAIGAVIFAIYSVLNEDAWTPVSDDDAIVVTPEKAAQLASGFEGVWRRKPNGDELQALMEDHVREEVLVREAIALGLDRDDTILRRRLRQKMEFLTESAARLIEPSEEAIADYYRENADRFVTGARIAFQQIFLGETASAEEVADAIAALQADGDPNAIGKRSLLPGAVPPSVAVAIDGTFGRGFFDQILPLETGAWQGPVRSGYGLHLVRVVDRTDASTPPLSAIREAVERDYLVEQAEALKAEQYARLRARYDVSLPAPDAVLGDQL